LPLFGVIVFQVLVSVPHVIQNLRNEIDRRFTLPSEPSGAGLKVGREAMVEISKGAIRHSDGSSGA
jgi:hypothetical protein